MKLSDVTPNLIVSDIARSTAFYRDTLGFSVVTTVPEQAPFAFVWLQRDTVHVFLNSRESANHELPAWGGRAIGGTNSLYILVEAETIDSGVDRLYDSVAGQARVVMDLKDQFYGIREFGIEDPDGYVIFFAQRTS
ncbi:MAG TPA: VOC family protein [Vicinamibacterales bacterium]|nr:VOC family protein [Vicinamibacterales bacterium]